MKLIFFIVSLVLSAIDLPTTFAGDTVANARSNIDSIIPSLFLSRDSTSPNTSRESINDVKSSLLTHDQLSNFDRDGFLVVSGLLEDEIDDLMSAGNTYVRNTKAMKAYFSSIEMGMIFQAGTSANDTTTSSFRRVALDSLIPQVVAELMRLSPGSTVRILRDIFMSRAVNQDSICGWHVDDVGFWPESYTSEHDGINVWIAMQDMPAVAQGSMALAPGSHKADWRFAAYDAIGQNRTYHGGFTKVEMQQRALKGNKLLTTCEMRDQAPEISEMIETTAFIPDIKAGDVIFMTRALFHRTATVTPAGKQFFSNQGIEYLNRYSIRYVPGTAILPKGWTFEWSIMANENNAGRTLDETMHQDNLLWYPQVWPLIDQDVDKKLNVIAQTKLDDVKRKSRAELFALISLFTQTQN